MHKLIIALAVLSTNAMSAPVDCDIDKQASIIIMKARQDGMLRYEMLARAKTSSIKTRVKSAYMKVQQVNPLLKQKAVDKFADKHMNKCLAS